MNGNKRWFGAVWASLGVAMTVAAIYLERSGQQSTALPALESFGPLFILLGLGVWWYEKKVQ